MDITDLVKSQQNVETKQEEYFNNLFGQLENLQSKLGEMDKLVSKIDSLEAKIDKYRPKTPQEKAMVRILVPVKRVIDYAVKIRVVGGKVETANVKASIEYGGPTVSALRYFTLRYIIQLKYTIGWISSF